MASLGATYDASQGEQMSDRSALPPGEYLAAIAKSDVGPTKKGDGGRKIELEFEVLDGAHRGRRFWTTLNLWNPNPVAVEMAQRELNSICHAVGKLRVADTQELHAIPVKVTLCIDKAGRNVAKSYKPASGGSAAVATSGAAETGRPRGPWA